jgi:hypothetical protein
LPHPTGEERAIPIPAHLGVLAEVLLSEARA